MVHPPRPRNACEMRHTRDLKLISRKPRNKLISCELKVPFASQNLNFNMFSDPWHFDCLSCNLH